MLGVCLALVGVVVLQQVLFFKERSRLIDRIMSKDFKEFKTTTEAKNTPKAIQPYENAIKRLSID